MESYVPLTRVCPRGASTYAWAAGDTAASVARRFGVTEQALRIINEFTVFDQLLPGDEVCIPPRPLLCVSGDVYTVEPGDSFSSIAADFGISVLELTERNPYADPNALTVGEVLCVPRRQAQTPTQAGRCPEGYTEGTVAYGQTYTDLLLRYNVSYQAMRLTNPELSPDALLPGQRYCVPPTGTRGLCSSGGRSYIMSQGETLASVAERLGVSEGRLLRLNQNLAPGDFTAGRVICVSTG